MAKILVVDDSCPRNLRFLTNHTTEGIFSGLF